MFGVMLILPIPCLFLLLRLARGYESPEEQAQQHCAPFSVDTLIFGGQGLAAKNKLLFSAADAGHRK
jgi:hypothetical protein